MSDNKTAIATKARTDLVELHKQRDTLAADATAILDRSEGTLTDEDKAEFERLEGELDGLKGREQLLQTLASGKFAIESGDGAGPGMYDAGRKSRVEPWDPNSGTVLDRAKAAVDTLHTGGTLPDYAAERVNRLISTEADAAAGWAVALSDPAYERAFAKLLGDPQRGHMLWTDEESDAYRRAALVRAPMGTGAGTGGEMIPLTLDPAIMLTSDGSNNPLRQIARVVQTTTNTWQGVTSAGATAEWKAEHAQAADGSPAVDEEEIPVHLGDVDVIYSYEVGMDASNFLGELRTVVLDAAEQLQATAFTTGTGTGQPAGVITGATTTVDTGGVFTAANVVALQNALPARFSGRAQWAGHIAVLNAIASFETTNGALRFPEMGAAEPRLLRKAVNELSNMTSNITTASSKFLLYGDFMAGFVIADRIGATLEILPGFGANQRPTAQRHAFLTFRTGSKVVVPQAFRLLNKTT